MRRHVRLVVCLMSIAATGVLAQESQREALFRTAANYVRVDMYVTRDGAPVRDLTADDVQVFEDGVRQSIDAFQYVEVGGPTQQLAARPPATVREGREAAADPRARVFVLFLDTYHTQLESSANIRGRLAAFLRRTLGPRDLVALMTPEMSATNIALGGASEVIDDVFSDAWWGRRGRANDNDPREDLYDICASALGIDRQLLAEWKARRREQLTLSALEDLVTHLAGLRDERKAVVVVTEGWALYRESRRLLELPTAADGWPVSPGMPPILQPPVQPPSNRGVVDRKEMLQCEADRIAMASIDHERRLRELGEFANRSTTTFYPVDPRGLPVFDAPRGPEPPPDSATRPVSIDNAILQARHTALRDLALATDGLAVFNAADVEAGLRRISADLSSYYLLGYYTTNTAVDNRYRSISVRVNRPGVNVRARRGYRAAAPSVSRSKAPGVLPDPARRAVSDAMARLADIPARPSFLIRQAVSSSDGGGGRVLIAGELDARTRRDPAWKPGGQAELILSHQGSPIATAMATLPTVGAFVVGFPDSVLLRPGAYTVRARLWSQAQSGMVLSDTVAFELPGGPAPLGDAVLYRRGPTTGSQYVATADPRFSRSDRIRLEMASSSAEKPAGRMLDRLGNALSVPVRMSEKPGPHVRVIVADATLAPLALGDYAIEVTAGNASQVTAFRVVP